MKTPKQLCDWIEKKCKVEEKDTDCWNSLKMYMGAFEQIEWERTLALDRLKQLGYPLGRNLPERMSE